MDDPQETLDKHERSFLRGARFNRVIQPYWVLTGISFVLLGLYLMFWNQRVFSHVDRMFTKGKIQFVLNEVKQQEPATDMERFQKVLVDEAYNTFIPDLFLTLGACALIWGLSLIIYIRAEIQWLRIVDKLILKGPPGK